MELAISGIALLMANVSHAERCRNLSRPKRLHENERGEPPEEQRMDTMEKVDSNTPQVAPENVIGRLPQFACSHWTGYGTLSELCHNYLHALSALKKVEELFAGNSPFYIKKLGSPITNGDQARIDRVFISVNKVIAKSEEVA